MIDLKLSLTSTGGVRTSSGTGQLRLGYSRNRGVYRLSVTPTGEWEGMTIRAVWHTGRGMLLTSLVENGAAEVPALLTAEPGEGRLTFEGSDGTRTLTSADIRYRVASNSGTRGDIPEPGTPAWQQLVGTVEQAKRETWQASEDARQSAAEAKQVLENAGGTRDEAVKAVRKAETEALNTIDEHTDPAKNTAVQAVQAAQEEAEQGVATAKAEALEAVDTAKESTLSDVETAQSVAVDAVAKAQDKAEQAVAAKQMETVDAVGAARDAAEQGVAKAKTDAVQAIDTSKESALSDVETARSGALTDIGTDRAAAIEAVGTAKTAAVTAVSDKQAAALDSIRSAGSGALTDISGKKAETVAAVEDAGQKTLASIPEDYTEMSRRVTTLEQTKAEVDDSSVTPTNPWSAKHLVDMLCPPIKETGNPARASDFLKGYPLGVTASWEPTQEGTGDPSPENIRPITGRDSVTVTRQEDGLTTTLTLPSAIYGGSVDAATGEGQETWKVYTLGKSDFYMSNSRNDETVLIGITKFAQSGISNGKAYSNQFKSYEDVQNNPGNYEGISRNLAPEYSNFIYIRIFSSRIGVDASDTSEDKFRKVSAWLDAQSAAGTPVQVASKLVEPVAFTATGGQDIPALDGVNTLTTDADSLTVTGRADPVRRVTALEDAVASMTNNE